MALKWLTLLKAQEWVQFRAIWPIWRWLKRYISSDVLFEKWWFSGIKQLNHHVQIRQPHQMFLPNKKQQDRIQTSKDVWLPQWFRGCTGEVDLAFQGHWIFRSSVKPSCFFLLRDLWAANPVEHKLSTIQIFFDKSWERNSHCELSFSCHWWPTWFLDFEVRYSGLLCGTWVDVVVDAWA